MNEMMRFGTKFSFFHNFQKISQFFFFFHNWFLVKRFSLHNLSFLIILSNISEFFWFICFFGKFRSNASVCIRMIKWRGWTKLMWMTSPLSRQFYLKKTSNCYFPKKKIALKKYTMHFGLIQVHPQFSFQWFQFLIGNNKFKKFGSRWFTEI